MEGWASRASEDRLLAMETASHVPGRRPPRYARARELAAQQLAIRRSRLLRACLKLCTTNRAINSLAGLKAACQRRAAWLVPAAGVVLLSLERQKGRDSQSLPAPRFFDSSGNPRLVPNSRGKIRKPGTKELQSVLRTSEQKRLERKAWPKASKRVSGSWSSCSVACSGTRGSATPPRMLFSRSGSWSATQGILAMRAPAEYLRPLRGPAYYIPY